MYRNKSDKELIKMWKNKKDKMAYKELKKRNKNMVYMFVNRYRSAPIPEEAIEAEAWSLFDQAVESYEPDKGAQFSTHLNFQLRKIDRYVKKYQNTARIPEALSGKIGEYDNKFNEMRKKKNRIPTDKEMSRELGIPETHIKRLKKSRRQDLFQGMYEGETELNNPEEKIDWILENSRDDLTMQEKQVFDHLTGYGGKRKIESKKEIARELNMSPGRVSQISNSIARKIKPQINKRF